MSKNEGKTVAGVPRNGWTMSGGQIWILWVWRNMFKFGGHDLNLGDMVRWGKLRNFKFFEDFFPRI
jgi:hypothetical protein